MEVNEKDEGRQVLGLGLLLTEMVGGREGGRLASAYNTRGKAAN